ncbi:uncharacterized protein LOC135839209 isoform X2 [Planococcus citri]|uniref:uncharacterized protein LOC135839209 isoform X2 n=1 Tax=Planococcus citri TaxID=170843 RepID=UPI0031F80F64
MLQIRSVVYISICFMLVQDVIHINQVHGQYKNEFSSIEEDDETTPHNAEQTEFATEPAPGPGQVADQESGDANDQELAGERNLNEPSQEAFPDAEDDTQDDLATTRRAFSKGKRTPFRTLATTALIPLRKEEEDELLRPLIKLGWTKASQSSTLKREFEFADFRLAFSFMTQVALISERISHFPDWYNFDSWVKITLCSKSIKGLTRKDIAIAQFASRVYERMMGRDDEILERSLTV